MVWFATKVSGQQAVVSLRQAARWVWATRMSSVLLRRTPFVAMMQATHLRNLYNGSNLRRLHGAGTRRILAQRQVSARFLLVVKIAAQNPS